MSTKSTQLTCAPARASSHPGDAGREYFATQMSSVFDAFSIAEAGAAQTSGFLLDASRMNRLAWRHARDQRRPGVQEVLTQVLGKTWKREPVPSSVIGGEVVQLAANWVVSEALLNLLDGGKLHLQVAAEVRQSLAELVTAYLKDPKSATLRAAPPVPPGAPI